MTAIPAARLGDTVSHTDSGFGFGLGGALGLAAGVLLVGATIATGGAALAVVAAVGGAVALAGGGALTGMNIGATFGEVTGAISTGSLNVTVNSRPAARTLADTALCDDHDGPQQIATGSRTVFINSMPASRLGDHTVCDARISSASNNVVIGGGTYAYAVIDPEVSPLAITIATDMLIAGTVVGLGAGAAAAFMAGGAAGAGIFGLQAAGGLVGGVAGGMAGGAIGGAIGGARGQAIGQAVGGLAGGLGGGAAAGRLGGALAGETGAAEGSEASLFDPKKMGQTEPGAVPMTPELKAQMAAADARGAMSAEGYPDLPADMAQTFGAEPKPWNGDDPANAGTMSRLIGSPESDNGSFWSPGDPPQTEGEWRGGSAVKNNWNGNGAYVQSPTEGLRGWTGPAAPQNSSDGVNVLPGGSQQIWLPGGSASPSAPMPSPWK